MYGPQGEKLSSQPKKANVNQDILKLLRATKEAMYTVSDVLATTKDPLGDFVDFKVRTDPVIVDRELVSMSQVPLINIALAKRMLAAGDFQPAMDEFVGTMSIFFNDFLPLRGAWMQAVILAEEAQLALRESEEVAAFASSLESLGKPHCWDADGVKTAAAYATDRIQNLAHHDIALPAMYVEYVRQAIDDAGMHLLANPPAHDPGARLQWSEAAMNIQLASVAHFSIALKGFAKRLSVKDIDQLACRSASTECLRLLGAVMWTLQPECRCNLGWTEIKQVLADSPQFLESLQAWTPIRDASVARITRARDLLLAIWGWAAAGCGGNKTLMTLFSWASLAAAILPIADMAQRLTPVYRALKQGIARVDRVPDDKKRLATAKAWTAALFLFDGNGERWWWLRLIRPAAKMVPWADSEDGGVDELNADDQRQEEAPLNIGIMDPAEKTSESRPSVRGEFDGTVEFRSFDEDLISADSDLEWEEPVAEAPEEEQQVMNAGPLFSFFHVPTGLDTTDHHTAEVLDLDNELAEGVVEEAELEEAVVPPAIGVNEFTSEEQNPGTVITFEQP
jgi:hypothetical protein